jgi:hypothetical protein
VYVPLITELEAPTAVVLFPVIVNQSLIRYYISKGCVPVLVTAV